MVNVPYSRYRMRRYAGRRRVARNGLLCETKPIRPPDRASEEVSSLKSQVSSGKGQPSSLPTSHFKLHTSRETPPGVTTSRACRAKQSQFGLEDKAKAGPREGGGWPRHETPYGVTTSRGCRAKQSQFAGPVSGNAGLGYAKQSQFPGSQRKANCCPVRGL